MLRLESQQNKFRLFKVCYTKPKIKISLIEKR